MVRPKEWYGPEIGTDPRYYENLRSLIGKTLEIFSAGVDHYGTSDPSLDEDIEIRIEHVDPYLP